MSQVINFEWPDTIDEQEVKAIEKRIKIKAHEMIQKGKLDLYEYALYIEQQLSLEELKEIVEDQIRRDRIEQLSEMRCQDDE